MSTLPPFLDTTGLQLEFKHRGNNLRDSKGLTFFHAPMESLQTFMHGTDIHSSVSIRYFGSEVLDVLIVNYCVLIIDILESFHGIFVGGSIIHCSLLFEHGLLLQELP